MTQPPQLKKIVFIILMLFGTFALAQSGTGANFEIDGDLYSSTPTVNTDDWFEGSSAQGVISEDSLLIFESRISNRENTLFHTGMSQPGATTQDGKFWYTALYAHDFVSLDNKRSPINDGSTFLNGENSDDPATWGIKSRSIPPKADIMDAYFHFRRDGVNASDSLWVNVGVATMDNGGSHYIDVELYIEPLEIVGSTFVNLGPDGGHTAWKFDGSGNVTQIGDIDLGFDYSGSTVLSADVRIWVSRTDFQNNIGFQYIDFYGDTDTSPYGYARINFKNHLISSINQSETQSPPWGTYANGLNPASSYEQHAFGEMAVNFTGIGLDPVQIFGQDLICGLPYRAILIKSRTSSSFTSKLVDFLGPYPLMGNGDPSVDTSIASVPPFDSCTPGMTQTMRAITIYPEYEYRWVSLTPGVRFPDGSTERTGVGLDQVDIDSPGLYELNIVTDGICPSDPVNATSLRVQAKPCAMNDSIVVEVDNDIVFEVWANDVDLDNNLDPVTVSNTGLLPPTNGTITIAPDTGEITYSPNPGYSGTDTFEYRICDYDGLCDTATVFLDITSPLPPPFADSDGDGILDKYDLDDDNDGITDADEQSVIIDNSQPACGGETDLDFSSPAILISGTDKQVGAVYRIANVTAGTDALITVTQIYNATIASLDNNSSDAYAFRPDTGFNFVNAGDQAMIEYKIRFVEAGGTLPVVIDKFFMNFNDIDGTNEYAEQTWALNPTSYVISNPTELTMYTDGEWVVATAGTTTYGGASNANPQVNFGANYNSKSEMTIRVGAVARVAGANSIRRLHHIEFNCVTNYVNPDVYGMDFDYDHVANHLDLDSDNDGIYDAVESGHGQEAANGIVSGPYGANGLADIVETSAESGVINYTIGNADGGEGFNFIDLDSDSDGCSDANEAYADNNADAGDNPFYGVGNPPITSDIGTVEAAGYDAPADIDGNSIPDYLEFNAPLITQHPVNQVICSGENAVFSIAGTPVTGYQWQKFDGITWVDLVDGGIYSGTTTDTLTLTNVPKSEDGSQYRVQLTHDTYVCWFVSDSAVLTVTESNVMANASSTLINSGESVTLTGSGALTYTWDQGITDGDTVILYKTTTFTVTGTDANGCLAVDSVTVTVNASTDISLEKSASDPTPNVGDTVSFTLSVMNSGPDPATNVLVEDVVPPGFEITTINNGGVLTGNTIQWDISFLPIGTVLLTYEVVVKIPTLDPGEYTNIAQIISSDQDDIDSEPGNDDGDQSEDDEDSHTIPVPTIDIEVNKTTDRTEGIIGDTIVFTITAYNFGPYAATNLEIEDILPDGFAFINSNADVGSYDQVAGVWTIPSLPVDTIATLIMETTLERGNSHTNVAEIAYVDQNDANPVNDRSDVVIDMLDGDCLIVYNEFSPNKDGLNDYFHIDCIEKYPDNFLRIYDRWGSLVYQKKRYDNSWTGLRETPTPMTREKELPVGTYYYILSFDQKMAADRTGWIYISR